MPVAYVPPGVSVTVVDNSAVQPVLSQETIVGLVGPAQGFLTKTDIVQLLDDQPATLSVSDGIDLSSLVVTSLDGQTTYVQGTATGNTGNAAGRPSGDYFILGNQIQRSMQTAIDDNTTVVVYYEVDSGSGSAPHTDIIQLNETTPVPLSAQGSTNSTQITAYAVQSEGVIPSSSYTIVLGSGSNNSTIAAVNGGVFSTSTKQTVYVDYNDATGTRHFATPVVLNGTAAVNIGTGTGASGGPDPGGNAQIVVKNIADNALTNVAFKYVSTADSTALSSPGSGCDFTITGNGSTPQTYSIFRPAGTVTLSQLPSGATVQVTYSATPASYWQPTVCFSQTDVENIYGPALDSSGNVSSPLSLAASFAFTQGAPVLVLQALFHQTIVNGTVVLTPGGLNTGSGSDGANLTDWQNTLIALRSTEDINVLVPIISASGAPSDNLALTVFEAVQDHIRFMRDQNNQYIVSICGEDSTVGSSLAQESVLQAHATTLGARTYAETMALISPAGFQYTSPVTGSVTAIGGQYAAAALAGLVAANAIQQPLTRMTIPSIVNVLDARTLAQKNADAAAGLMVVENFQGIVRVRHAITVDDSTANSQEFSVVRGKGFVIENVVQDLDQALIGKVTANQAATALAQSITTNALDQMQAEGIITAYASIQAALSTTNPTTIEVRFAYQPAEPLNYVNVTLSLNTITSTVQTNVSA